MKRTVAVRGRASRQIILLAQEKDLAQLVAEARTGYDGGFEIGFTQRVKCDGFFGNDGRSAWLIGQQRDLAKKLPFAHRAHEPAFNPVADVDVHRTFADQIELVTFSS